MRFLATTDSTHHHQKLLIAELAMTGILRTLSVDHAQDLHPSDDKKMIVVLEMAVDRTIAGVQHHHHWRPINTDQLMVRQDARCRIGSQQEQDGIVGDLNSNESEGQIGK